MTKPFTKLTRFSKRRSALAKRPLSSAASLDAAEHLDGISCFETMRAYGGRVFALPEHLRRLGESCKGIGRSLPISEKKAVRWVCDALRESGHADAILRASVHWASGGRGEVVGVVIARAFSGHPAEWYENGVAMKTCAVRRPEPRAQDPQIKATQFVAGVLAHLEASGERPHEFLFLGPGGQVAEGTVSNVFVVSANWLLTPPAASGILKGVTRQTVLRCAAEIGVPLRETPLTRHDVYAADECFMTNTSSEVLPVTAVDGRRIGSGAPGPLTRRIAAAFKQTVRASLSRC